ncbi:MAG: SDR family NAD(P)-dependent oxidoreductase [Chloroflexota bacterium]
MDVRLDGKVAFVTGGGGGFGRAFSAGFAESGASVAVVDWKLDDAESAAASIRATGGKAQAFQCDVRLADAVNATVQRVVDEFGGLDILMNIAGQSGRSPAQELSEEDWDLTLDINLKGMFLCCKAAIPHLISRGGGRIINMASSRGIHGQPNAVHYSASKGASIALTKSLAQELKQHRITVNAIAPGGTDTPGWEGKTPPAEVAARRAKGNIGQPGDLVPMAVMLASDFGYQITGHLVVRDIYMPR